MENQDKNSPSNEALVEDDSPVKTEKRNYPSIEKLHEDDSPVKTEKRSYPSTRKITYTALLAALLCVLSPFTLPVGPVPISLGSLAVYIASVLIDWKHGTAAVAVYVLLGAFGVPVFTGFSGGFAKIAGPTGGYILGYVPCAVVIGLIVDHAEKHVWAYPLAMLAGTAVLYAFGTAWFMFEAGATLKTALSACVVPFLLGDALKIVFATALCYKLRFILKNSLHISQNRR